MPEGTTTSEHSAFGQLWRENHGNFLLAFAGGILIVGAIAMLWPEPEPRLLLPEGGPYNYEQLGESGEGRESQEPPQSTEEEGESEPQRAIETSLLLIRIAGVQSNEGQIRIAIYTDPLTYNQPSMAAYKNSLDAQPGAEWKVEVPANKPLAITVYHDENNNDTLDRNLLGIPSERYGFSRGARSQTGPPPFADAAFVPEPGVVEVPVEIW